MKGVTALTREKKKPYSKDLEQGSKGKRPGVFFSSKNGYSKIALAFEPENIMGGDSAVKAFE
jgi:hypothetical protein